jgi:hypothetical protein
MNKIKEKLDHDPEEVLLRNMWADPIPSVQTD